MKTESHTVQNEPSDEELALALQRGNESAFEKLVQRYQGRVYAIALRVTLNREDALDVAQEVFVKVFMKIRSWQPSGAFGSWITRLAVNQAIDSLRRRKRREHWSLSEYALLEEPLSKDAAGDAAHASEISERVRLALDALSPTQRIVFVMRHYEGLQLNEIAEAIGCTVGSVKVHLFRAIRKMQEQLLDLKNGMK
ncbi:MAG TPA: RNA polymerase sigma factor [Candidatus Hydrogenedentes bacterium]|nr:RNA polymerase sigma factor [Candidatus Hydrogenedentota bacterium]HOL76666.1 RNA polymerase sigma factor [Candidatus Hydrogenedentota bacterium]HPO84499.1 RNA polymerase sigma factor [Candidatus Hydrogenedentota bacterium]